MKQLIEKVTKMPWVAHILRTVARFNNRQGPQFAAAMTYFSVLVLVPLAMLAFSGLGLVLSNNPELADTVKSQVTSKLGGSRISDSVSNLIDKWISDWPGVGIFGVLTALWAGQGWVANTKKAVRAQWRPEFEQPEDKPNFFRELAINTGTLVMMLLVCGITIVGSQASTWLSGWLLRTIGLGETPAGRIMTWIAGLLISLLFAFLLFLFLMRVLPKERTKPKPWLIGSVIGAFAVALLLQSGSLVFGLFANNQAAKLFGPVIVGMLMFNLFATIVLLVAAWIATWNQPAVARHWHDADLPLKGRKDVETCEGHWEDAEEDRLRVEAEKRGEEYKTDDEREDSPKSIWLRQRRGEIGPQPGQKPDPADPHAPVDPKVAKKAVQAGMGAGYAVGAATGVGIGALIVRIVAWIAGRRARR